MNFFNAINPLKHFSEGEYLYFWQILFVSVLEGFWARFLSAAFLLLAFWFGVRRQRFQRGLIFFGLACLITYGSAILRLFGLL